MTSTIAVVRKRVSANAYVSVTRGKDSVTYGWHGPMNGIISVPDRVMVEMPTLMLNMPYTLTELYHAPDEDGGTTYYQRTA